ncbi:MAG: hypothetical protein HYZ28_03880 [Myxococcales bacterium]|nr:hypothetical protein [Myxococcales bacterium]
MRRAKPDRSRVGLGGLTLLLSVLIGLGAYAQTARVALRWKAVPGAARYELEIARDSGFKQVVLRTAVETAGHRWEELPAVTYYWRVRSIDAEGRLGEWSAPQTIAPAAAAPSPVAPANGEVVACSESARSVQLTVESSRFLKEYFFEVASDARFTSRLAERRSTTARADFPLTATGTFYWRASGTDLAGRATASGESRSFRVALGAPRPRPLPGAVWAPPVPGERRSATSVMLSWGELPCAAGYKTEVWKEGSERRSPFSSPGSAFAYSPPAPGEYAFRVAAVDAQGAAGEWSPAASFAVRLPGPSLLGPADGATVASRRAIPALELRWTAVPEAAEYEVQLSKDSSFQDPQVERARASSISIAPPEAGTHHWRVLAIDSSGLRSAASEARSLQAVLLTPLPAPRATSPPPEAVLPRSEEVSLGWEPVPEAASYEVSVGPLSEGEPATRTAKASPLPVADLADGEHAFRLRAVDAEGAAGEWSAPTSFWLGVPPIKQAVLARPAAPPEAGSASLAVLHLHLLDSRGRPVRGASPEATATHGSVEKVTESEEGYEIGYRPPGELPEAGEDSLRIRERDFAVVARVPLTRGVRRLSAAARVGWNSNLGALSSPYFSADVTYRTGALSDRLLLSVRAGLYGGRAEIAAGLPAPVQASAQVAPLSALALYAMPLEPVELYAGLGPSVQLAKLELGESFELRPVAGAHAVLGGRRRVGNGALSAELGLLMGGLDASLARLRTGGLNLAVGYGVEL